MWLYPPFPISAEEEAGPTNHVGSAIILSDAEVFATASQTIRNNSVLLTESIILSNGIVSNGVVVLPEANGSIFAPSTIRGFSEVF